MPNKLIQSVRSSVLSAPIGFAFGLCFIYWIYLLFTSRMTIVYDAAVYEQLGAMLYHSGWIEFFKTGPHNEPVYPLLIAFSMRIADSFLIPYLTVQTCFQILILFSTQLLTLFILKRLQMSRGVKALTILYMGISPALVNATFSLFSEIATYPFILGIIIAGVKGWESILSNNYKKPVNLGQK